jgi:hypothetical protein
MNSGAKSNASGVPEKSRKDPNRSPTQLRAVDKPGSPEELASWIDELGQLESEISVFRPKLTRIATLRELIRERFDDRPKEKSFETRGARFGARLGPRAYQRALDAEALAKAIGLRAYAAIARPTLQDVTETVAPHIAAKCITQDYTGARPLETFPIGQGK